MQIAAVNPESITARDDWSRKASGGRGRGAMAALQLSPAPAGRPRLLLAARVSHCLPGSIYTPGICCRDRRNSIRAKLGAHKLWFPKRNLRQAWAGED